MPVRWRDMDAVGHVNNATYFVYVESGRIDYFEALGARVGGDLVGGPILADIQCSFIGQLKYPAQIDIGTRTTKIGGKSFTVEAGIFIAGTDELVATSRGVVVWFDYENQQTVLLPDLVRERILELEAVPPEM